MEKVIAKVFIYPLIFICALVAYSQYGYFDSWFAYPENPVRHENLAGALLVGLFSSPAWLGVIFLALKKKRNVLFI